MVLIVYTAFLTLPIIVCLWLPAWIFDFIVWLHLIAFSVTLKLFIFFHAPSITLILHVCQSFFCHQYIHLQNTNLNMIYSSAWIASNKVMESSHYLTLFTQNYKSCPNLYVVYCQIYYVSERLSKFFFFLFNNDFFLSQYSTKENYDESFSVGSYNSWDTNTLQLFISKKSLIFDFCKTLWHNQSTSLRHKNLTAHINIKKVKEVCLSKTTQINGIRKTSVHIFVRVWGFKTKIIKWRNWNS